MNLYNKIKESNDEKVCVLCGKTFSEWGNNPWPLADDGLCCDECNMNEVVPARVAQLYSKKEDSEEKDVKESLTEDEEQWASDETFVNELKKTSKLIYDMSKEVKQAFSGFKGNFTFSRPDGKIGTGMSGAPYINDIDYSIYVGSTIFHFRCDCHVYAGSRKVEVSLYFEQNGMTNGSLVFTLENAQNVLTITKIAYDLIKKFEQEFKDNGIKVELNRG